MEYFEVTGGPQLSGEIVPQGAKNEALQILAAVLLTDQTVTISNLPDILDVNRMIDLLDRLGVDVEQTGEGKYKFRAENVNIDYLLTPEAHQLMSKLRGSVMIMGPLLARFGAVYVSKPGGDKIGRRRIDVHLKGMADLGAEFKFDPKNNFFSLHSPDRLTGTYMLLEEASVTGTANILMAATLAKGTTTIYNAACEPYLQQLARMLQRMGAKIEGVGSNLLTIEGVENLGGTTHRLNADMIEVGSFIGLAAMTASKITIKNADVDELGLIPSTFRKLGIQIDRSGNDLIVDGRAVCEIMTYMDGGILTLYDNTWPGLTPDLLSVLLVVATQCRGTVLIHQKMFESRLFFVDKLIDMGANIILCDPHRATVIGQAREFPLRGISMTSPDIRAGVALLLAALSADGTSKIYNIEQIDRGYQNIEGRLQALGAGVVRKVE
ncbi:MAG: UDP-N-acetylglucosamine 1-carboxyvinyltransferase [Bacteroidota bacterium]